MFANFVFPLTSVTTRASDLFAKNVANPAWGAKKRSCSVQTFLYRALDSRVVHSCEAARDGDIMRARHTRDYVPYPRYCRAPLIRKLPRRVFLVPYNFPTNLPSTTINRIDDTLLDSFATDCNMQFRWNFALMS